MATTNSRPGSRRLVFYAFWLGCALLAGSLAGAGWSLNNSSGGPVPAEPPAATKSVSRSVGQGHVDVETGVFSLYPAQPGRVKKVFVHESDVVATDAPLFQMDDALPKFHVDQAKADLAIAEADLKLAQQLPAQRQAGIDAQKSIIAAKKQELSAAMHRYEHARRLSAGNDPVGSPDDTKIAKDAVSALEAVVDAEKAKLRGLEKNDPQDVISKARRAVEAKKVQLELAEHALKECVVRAPCKGKVLRLQLNAGELLGPTPHYPVLQFCPDGPRIIRAEIEQEFAGALAENQIAKIHDDSSGDLRWTGRVRRISDWYAQRRSIIHEPLQFNDVRTVECIIAVDPNGPPLRIGQRVLVTLENAN